MPWERDWGKSTSLSGFFGQEASSVSGLPTLAGHHAAEPNGDAQRLAGRQSDRRRHPIGHRRFQVRRRKGLVRAGHQAQGDPCHRSRQAVQPAGASHARALFASRPVVRESRRGLRPPGSNTRKRLELDPQDVNALIAFARFHDRQGNGDEALRLYQQAQALAPTNTTVSNDLGLFYARRGNLDASLNALQQAVRLDPHNVRYRNNLAATLIASHRVPEAIAVLREVHPEATALFNAACLLSLNHETQQAASLLEESLRIDPSLAAAQEELRDPRSQRAPRSHHRPARLRTRTWHVPVSARGNPRPAAADLQGCPSPAPRPASFLLLSSGRRAGGT